MDVFEYGADLIKSAVVFVFASLSIFRNCAISCLEEFLILHQPKIGLVHLTAHIFEVVKNSYFVLLSVLLQESFVAILIVDQSLLRCNNYIFRGWIAPYELFAAM